MRASGPIVCEPPVETTPGDRPQPAETADSEQAFTFPCEGDWLTGIVHRPAKPRQRGVLIVVGGPQYRVGSHRQFLLLARDLARRGIPVMRFDYRGMGDAEGAPVDFRETAPDIQAAVDAFAAQVPQLSEIVLWGLCDGASASAFAASRDARVTGLVLLNPWVRSEQGIARTYLRHYYLQRLFSRDFWHKVMRGGFDARASLRGLLDTARRVGTAPAAQDAAPADGATSQTATDAPHHPELGEWMGRALSEYPGRVLLIMSGNDLTAREFDEALGAIRRLRNAVKRPLVSRVDLLDADHTFSRAEWRDQVARATADWMDSW